MASTKSQRKSAMSRYQYFVFVSSPTYIKTNQFHDVETYFQQKKTLISPVNANQIVFELLLDNLSMYLSIKLLRILHLNFIFF